MFFNLRIIALQNFIVLCRTTTWISHSLQIFLILAFIENNWIPKILHSVYYHILFLWKYMKKIEKYFDSLPSYCVCLVAQSCPTLCDLVDCSLPSSSVHGNSPEKSTGEGCHALLQGIFPSLEPRSPELQAPSLPSEPPGKPT